VVALRFTGSSSEVGSNRLPQVGARVIGLVYLKGRSLTPLRSYQSAVPSTDVSIKLY